MKILQTFVRAKMCKTPQVLCGLNKTCDLSPQISLAAHTPTLDAILRLYNHFRIIHHPLIARETSLSIEILTVEEVGRHQELQGDLRLYWKLGYFCGAVGVAHLVREVHTNLRE